MTLAISLNPEYIFSVFGFPVTNTLFGTILVTVILAIVALIFYYRRDKSPLWLTKALQALVYELLKLADAVTQDRNLSKKVLPLVSTFFIFILTANLIALVPGFLGSIVVSTPAGDYPLLRSPNSDLNTTIALALFSVVAIQYFAVRALGPKLYLKRFFNFSSIPKFFVGFFELISEGVKILSFSFRLFGNIFAGEVLLLVIAFLVPYFVPLPFMILEIFVGVIQAFIFAILTLAFIKTSIVYQNRE